MSRRAARAVRALTLSTVLGLLGIIAAQAPALAAFLADGTAQTSVSTATLAAPASASLTTTRCQANGRWTGTATWPGADRATGYTVTLFVDGSELSSTTTTSTSAVLNVTTNSNPTRTFSVTVESGLASWTSAPRSSGTVSC